MFVKYINNIIQSINNDEAILNTIVLLTCLKIKPSNIIVIIDISAHALAKFHTIVSDWNFENKYRGKTKVSIAVQYVCITLINVMINDLFKFFGLFKRIIIYIFI